VPDTVAGHPRLFVTFTAPSFGRVHTRKAQGLLVHPCHPYRQSARCPHGRRLGCWQRHDADDPRLGEPLCGRCYQAGAQVLWNALAGRLWSRTIIYLYRALAQLVGLPEAELRAQVRISFAKVAEYQKRGAVHFHAIIRLDAATTCGCCPAYAAPSPAGFTVELLEAAVRQAAGTVAVPCPPLDEDQAVTLVARWGEQLDVRRIREAGDETELSAEQVAGYVAKYATKATEALGVTLDHPIGEVELEGLDLPAHVAELVRASWELGARLSLTSLRLRKWAHMLGFGGLLDQEPPLLHHPGGAAAGPGRLCHPPAPRERDPARYLGTARGRPGRDRGRLLDLRRAGLPDDRGGVAGSFGGGSGTGRAPGGQRGTAEHNGGRMTANRYGMEAR
jgi:hypothetical protein